MKIEYHFKKENEKIDIISKRKWKNKYNSLKENKKERERKKESLLKMVIFSSHGILNTPTSVSREGGTCGTP